MRGDDRQDAPQLWDHAPALVDHGDGVAAHALRPELVLHPCPGGQDGTRPRLLTARRLVEGVERGQPHEAAADPGGHLHGDGIEAADGLVERDRPDHVDAGFRGLHDRGPLGRGGVVGLEHESRHAQLTKAAREREVGRPAPEDVRVEVQVQVVRSANEVSGTGRWDGVLGHGFLLRGLKSI